jgi:hypothetical protein
MAAAIAACGGSGPHMVSLSSVPLVPGGTVVAQARVCDGGAGSFCGIELVIENPSYASSRALVLAQRDRLKAQGWIGSSPDTGQELADESPGHKLRLTYATATDDLEGLDLGWIKRSATVASALDRSLFTGTPTISLLLEVGVQ